MEKAQDVDFTLDSVDSARLSAEAKKRGITPEELASELLSRALESKANMRPKVPPRRH